MQTVDVLIKPVVSEKAVSASARGEYVFLVDARARKEDIRKAVERHYQVNVVAVTTAQFRTSPRRQTRRRIENPGALSKKAYVTLKSGQSLHLLEVAEE